MLLRRWFGSFQQRRQTLKKYLTNYKKLQQNFGSPRRIITDKRAAFTSNDFRKYCQAENIQHTETTGMPRGNGQVERINRSIIPVLTKLSLMIRRNGLNMRHYFNKR